MLKYIAAIQVATGCLPLFWYYERWIQYLLENFPALYTTWNII